MKSISTRGGASDQARTMQAVGFVVAVALLSGCTFHHEPYVAYESATPLSNTAVLVVTDHDPGISGVIGVKAVDGRETSCAQAGCPVWVRVLPGTHQFVLEARLNHRLSASGIVQNVWTPKFTIQDMKPRHVYKARIQRGNELTVTVSDLGKSSDFSLDLGPHGKFRPSFEDKKP
jgi:hypothetical protein